MLSLFLQWSCSSTKAHEASLPHRMALGSQLSLHPLLAPLCRGDSEKGKGKVTQSFFSVSSYLEQALPALAY